MWGVFDFAKKRVHRLDPRKHQLDPPAQHKVNILSSFTLIKNLLNSTVRSNHVAWVPQSLPNSIVLLGGIDGAAARFTAEIVPGFEKWSSFHLFFVAGGGNFALRHSGN